MLLNFLNKRNNGGTIEEGKRADLILLDKNPLENIENITSIQTTIINGKVYGKNEILLNIPNRQ